MMLWCQKCSIICHIELLQSVIELEVELQDVSKKSKDIAHVINLIEKPVKGTTAIQNFLRGIDLSGVPEEQKYFVLEMLREGRKKGDVAVPKPLHPEAEPYIENFLNCTFMIKSTTSASSPVVCVRKRNHTLQLCEL